MPRILLAVFLVLSPFLASNAWAGPPADPCTRQASVLETLEAARAQGSPNRVARGLEAQIRRRAQEIADECVALNQIQVLGSHNSYHQRPRVALMAALLFFDPMFFVWQYDHVPLPEQFSDQAVRQIELDVFYDPNGGLYSFRAGLTVIGDNPFSPLPEMYEPGMKVLHVQDLDFETTCATFVACLQEVKDWSDAHAGHLPIMVLVEVKDDPIPDPVNLGFVTPLPFTPEAFDALDAEIRSVFPEEQMITPDSVRVPGLTLEQSVTQVGWPTLDRARGRVLFALDNRRSTYIEGRPNLEGRVAFTDGVPGQPDAAFVKRNDPLASLADIQQLVSEGYLVRTRADADTVEARTGDTTRRDAALASGAQFVSSDYPVPDPTFGTGYQVVIPGGEPARCNPVNGAAGCREAFLEGL